MKSRTKTIIINIIKSFPIALLVLGLSNCGSNGKTININKTAGFQQSHGPFDSNGNYIENWADNAPKRKFTRTTSVVKKPTPTLEISKRSITRNITPVKTYTPPTKKATPRKIAKKPTVRKVTPKTKPPVFHTVKKGDTLYALGRKYGTSVSAIQKANRIEGSNISIGKRLIIPRK